MVLLPIVFYSGITPLLHPLFPGGSRCASFSFSHSLVVAVVGGTASLLSTWLKDLKGWPNGLILYLLMQADPSVLGLVFQPLAFTLPGTGLNKLRGQGTHPSRR